MLTRAAALRAVAGVAGARPRSPPAVAAPPVAVAPPTALAPSAFNPSGPDAAIYGLTPEGFLRADQVTWWQLPYLVDSHSRLDEIFPPTASTRRRRRACFAAPRRSRRSPIAPTERTARSTGTWRAIPPPASCSSRTTPSWSSAISTAAATRSASRRGPWPRRSRRCSSASRSTRGASARSTIGRSGVRSGARGHRVRGHADPPSADDVVGRALQRGLQRARRRGPARRRHVSRRRPGRPRRGHRLQRARRRAGTRFAYASSETQVLGLVLRAAVGRPVAAYLSEKIWQPMGAEADASWLIDRTGQEST